MHDDPDHSGTKDICVLGAGVSGITTAIVLSFLGYRVRVLAERTMELTPPGDGGAVPPTFASMFPAASIIPHTVAVADVSWHINTSLRFFSALQFAATTGVRRQRHYELFEQPVPIPEYAESLDALEILDEVRGTAQDVPHRTGCEQVWGWSFDCFFAEMPEYRRWLIRLLAELGGTTSGNSHVSAENIETLPEPIVVNCMGYGASALFGTPEELTLVKGILVRVLGDTAALFRGGRAPFSYNYTPEASVYPTLSGALADVYCYPRLDAWILGGTRLPGHMDEQGRWSGEDLSPPTVEIKGVEVPCAIVDVNRDLLKSTVGVDIGNRPMDVLLGYRCVRDASHGGVRLESENSFGKLVVHNYGHGGAGVTLSWSSAIRVAQLIAPTSTAQSRFMSDGTAIRLLQELVVSSVSGD